MINYYDNYEKNELIHFVLITGGKNFFLKLCCQSGIRQRTEWGWVLSPVSWTWHRDTRDQSCNEVSLNNIDTYWTYWFPLPLATLLGPSLVFGLCDHFLDSIKRQNWSKITQVTIFISKPNSLIVNISIHTGWLRLRILILSPYKASEMHIEDAL